MEEQFMKVALKQAQIAFDKGDVPVGAVIVKNNKIIAKAYNRKEKTNDSTDHAEIIAIKKACKRLKDWRLNDCVMYVTLQPCPMCEGAIHQSRISKVIYGTKNTNDIENQTKIENGTVLECECAQILKIFFQNKRKS
jgi:tRNA(adenine34) deaminase